MMGGTESSLLERLIIEVAADDKNLEADLRRAVQRAEEAAARMTSALQVNIGTSGLQNLENVAAAARQSAAAVRETGTASLETVDRIRQLNQTLASLKQQYRAGLIDMNDYRTSVRDVERELDDLRSETDENTGAWERLVKGMGDARTVINQLNIRELYAEVTTLRDETEKAGGASADTAQRLKQLMQASDELASTFERGTTEFRRANLYGGQAARMYQTLTGEVTTFGLSANVALGSTKGITDALAQIGPEGQRAIRSLEGLGITADNLFASTSNLTRALQVGLFAALTAVTAKVTSFVKETGDWATSLQNTAALVNMTTTELQELGHIATQAGVDASTLNDALRSAARRAGDAMEGTSAAAKVYRELGVSVTDAEGKLRGTMDILIDTADAFARLEDGGRRTALAQDIFGRSSARLIPVLAQGGDAIRAAAAEAHELGLVLSDDALDGLADFSGELDGIRERITAAGRSMAADFVPFLRDTVVPFLENIAIPVFQRLTDAATSLIGVFAQTGNISNFRMQLLAMVTAMGAARTAIGATALALRGLGIAVNFAAPWLRILTAAVTAVAGIIGWRAVGGNDSLNSAIEDLNEALAAVDTAVRPGIAALESLGNAAGPQELQGAINALASTLNDEGQKAFLDYAAQAIASGDDVATVAENLRKKYLEMLRDLAQFQLDTARQAQTAAAQSQQATLDIIEGLVLENDEIQKNIRLQEDRVDTARETLAEYTRMLEDDPTSAVAHAFIERSATNLQNELKVLEGLKASMDEQTVYRDDLIRQFGDTMADVNADVAELEKTIAALNHAVETGDTSRLEGLVPTVADLSDLFGDTEEKATGAGKAIKEAAVGSITYLQKQLSAARELRDSIVPGTEAWHNAEAAVRALEAELRSLEAFIESLRRPGFAGWLDDFTDGITAVINNIRGEALPILQQFGDTLNTHFGAQFADYRAAVELLDDYNAELEAAEAKTRAAGEAVRIMFRRGEDFDAVAEAAEKFGLELDDLKTIAQEFGYVFPEIAPTVEILPGALETYRDGLLKTVDAERKMSGATRDTRIAYLDAITAYEAELATVERGSKEWLALADALVKARAELLDITRELMEASRASQGFYESAAAAVQAFDEQPDLDNTVLTPLLWVQLRDGIQAAREEAEAFSQPFDELAARREILEGIITTLADDSDAAAMAVRNAAIRELAEVLQELAVQDAESTVADLLETIEALGREAPSEVQQLRAELEELAAAGADTADALIALEAAERRLALAGSTAVINAQVNASTELRNAIRGLTQELTPVEQLQKQIQAELTAGNISIRQAVQLLLELREASERLAWDEQAEAVEKAQEAYEQLRESVENMGRDVSPTAAALKELQALYDAGRISGTQYADALAAIEEASDRLKPVGSTLTDAFRTLSDAVREGSITAEELTASLSSIGGMMQQLGSEVGGTAGELISFGGTLMEIGAQVASGDWAGAIMTGITKLFDFSNGVREIENTVRQTTSRSSRLWKGFVEDIAAGATESVRRGGFLGLLGIRKQQLDEEAYNAGVQLAEGIISGFERTLTSGDFEEAWDKALNDIIIEGAIQALFALEDVREAIKDAYEFIAEGDYESARERMNGVKDTFRETHELIQEVLDSDPGTFLGDWLKNVAGIGVPALTELERAEASLDEALKKGTITAEEYADAYAELEEARARVNDAAHDEWLERVDNIGVPALTELERVQRDLNDALAEGRINQDQFAEGMDRITAAGERLAAQDFESYVDSIRSSLASGIASGFREGASAYLASGDFNALLEDLEGGIFVHVSNALFDALAQMAMAKALIEDTIGEIAEALASGDDARARNLMGVLSAATQEVAQWMAPILDEWRRVAPASVRRGWEPSRPDTGRDDWARGGGIQISEITGPTRDLLLDALSPLAGLDGLLGVNISQLEVMTDIRDSLSGTMPFPDGGIGTLTAAGDVNITNNIEFGLGDWNLTPDMLSDPDFRSGFDDLIEDYFRRQADQYGGRP